MSRNEPPPGPSARAVGCLLLLGGLTVAGSLILSGIGAAGRDEPDMAHVNQLGATLFCGAPAVLAIGFGFYVRRWGWR